MDNPVKVNIVAMLVTGTIVLGKISVFFFHDIERKRFEKIPVCIINTQRIVPPTVSENTVLLVRKICLGIDGHLPEAVNGLRQLTLPRRRI